MKFSVSSYSFWQYLSSGKMTQLETVKAAHDIGFETMEFIDMSPCKNPTFNQQLEYAKEIKKEADKYNMNINAYTIGACMCMETDELDEKEFERLMEQIEIACVLGAKIMRHDAVFDLRRYRSFDLSLPTIAKNIKRVSEYARSKGIKTCIENHGFICQDSERVERLYNAVDCDNFGLLVDMGNFACVDENSQLAVSRLAPYAIHVHAKDFEIISGLESAPKKYGILTRGGNFINGAAVGEGNIPVKACLRALKRAGYNGIVSLEYEGQEDAIVGIKKGLDNLIRINSELETE